jgi:hypothetical protein
MTAVREHREVMAGGSPGCNLDAWSADRSSRGRALWEWHMVRVGVEQHDAQSRLEQQLLEQDAELARLARALLTAQKGMAIEGLA